mmetsp:Transcript_12893/g.21492  ORF Transcript_12893/g.21492 Transcript_12893/m.21492 type:complete len:460 (-) Transcript_12893:461-1840(-)|eukprot:CAMPEP_0181046704 /NCGR_PEP_ID=MMETSP1070-20121207/14487_1 /TAXON_ID=265543 /ORGANISM="Minutocellus polymorphus, Strain NH13" /LENGTH=459 /DNA_ID=CAMNT_0023125325 /DNA_START=41 /DNA_END=1420 /DNA_ORIENTATION=+
MEEEEETAERRQAELDFVASAYGEEEAWVVEKAAGCHVKRRLALAASSSELGGAENCCLTISMPEGYPVNEDALLGVEAHLCNDSSSSPALRKIAINALSSLVSECRRVVREHAGGEAVFPVLARADEWVSTDWMNIVETAIADTNAETPTVLTKAKNDSGELVLGRKLIHSHHIIAESKRKAIVELAQHYNIGGCYKYGWPGVIIIEGEEADCISYVEEIRTLRWQHLIVRGEQHVHVIDRSELEKARVLPSRMQDLGDDMSVIAKQCKEAGLEELFLTSMKIYRNDGEKDTKDERNSNSVDANTHRASYWRYGVLCHVDHMNDAKQYRKWLRKAAAVAGCTLQIKICDATAKRPIIIVAVVGEEDDVKIFMKRWRTSRVDVDSAGRPCLERMMTVLIEGTLDREKDLDNVGEDILAHVGSDKEEKLIVSEACLTQILRAIGGPSWSDEFASMMRSRR